jgi:hypothetical protein
MGLRAGKLASRIDGVEEKEAWEMVCYGKGVQSSIYKVGRGHTTTFEAFNVGQKGSAVSVNRFDTTSMTLELSNTSVRHHHRDYNVISLSGE